MNGYINGQNNNQMNQNNNGFQPQQGNFQPGMMPNQGVPGQQTPYNVPNNSMNIQPNNMNMGMNQPNNMNMGINSQPVQNTPQQMPPQNNFDNMMKGNPQSPNLTNEKAQKAPKPPKKEPGTTASVLLTMIMMIIIFGCLLYIGSTLGYVTINLNPNQEDTTVDNNNESNNNIDQVDYQKELNTKVSLLANWFNNQIVLSDEEKDSNYSALCSNGCKEKTIFTEETKELFTKAGLDSNDYILDESSIIVDENNKICVILKASETGTYKDATNLTVESENCKGE